MECHSPLPEVTMESPVLSYSVAKREGRRIVGLLEELMSTPLADTQQPSLVDLSLTSTPGSAGDVPLARCNLFKSPTLPSRENGAASCLLDTTNPKPRPSGLTATLINAMEELDVASASSGEPEVVEAKCLSPSPLISIACGNSAASSETEVDHGDSYIVGDAQLNVNESPSIENRGNGATPFASPFAAPPADKDPDRCRVKVPLIFFSPAETATKPTGDCTVQSGSDDRSSVLPAEVVLNGCVSSTVDNTSPVVAATALLPNGDCSTVAVDRCQPTVPEVPHFLALHNIEDSLAAGGDDSFRTAYDDSPLPPCRRSFVVSKDGPLIASGNVPVATSQGILPKASGDSPPSDSAAVTAAETTLAPSDEPVASGLDSPANASEDDLPSDSLAATVAGAAETTFALPTPASKPASDPLASKLQASSSSASDTTTVVAGRAVGKSVLARPPGGSSLQTRKSLLPPPTTSQRPGRPSTLVKPRAPLGLPSVASKAAEATFATDKTVQLASARKGAQPSKQEQAPARSRLSALPRRPLGAPSTGTSAAGSRQCVPGPSVAANGVIKQTAGRVSAVTKVVAAAPSTSSVPARTARLPPPTTTTAGARTAALGLPRVSASTSRGGGSKTLPRPAQANGKPPVEPQTRQAGLPRSRIAAPKTRVAGFSRLPMLAGSTAGNRAALLVPVPESPLPERLSSTPVRSDLSPRDVAVCPELTPILRH